MSKKHKSSGSNKTTALSKTQFDYVITELLDKNDKRMVLVCRIMWQCVRIGDVLKSIKVKDVYKKDFSVREEIYFTEEKTGKRKQVLAPTGSIIRSLFEEYKNEIGGSNRGSFYGSRFSGVGWESVLFYNKKRGTPLTDKGVKRILSQFVGNERDLKRGIEQCSPHSFRKGGAKWLHVTKGVSIEIIRAILNHSGSKETLTYLDIKPVEVRECMRSLAE